MGKGEVAAVKQRRQLMLLLRGEISGKNDLLGREKR